MNSDRGMIIFDNIETLRNHLGDKAPVVFVPTMGNLHAGHLSLVKRAKQLGNHVVVSIFINRLQFLPHEDFDRYPRTFDQDCRSLSELKVNSIFAPHEKILFPTPQEFLLALPPIADLLEGKFRLGFFRGVATIVLKLFNIVQPQLAVFGKKDYQQLHIIREMVRQLNIPVEIAACETVRAPDGLALSSRNQYLNQEQREEACQLFQTFLQLKNDISAGNKDFPVLQQYAEQRLNKRGWNVDYLSVHRRSDLLPAEPDDKDLVILGAAWLGKTRLIDSMEI